MRLTPRLFLAVVAVSLSVEAAEFRDIRLEEDGSTLNIVRSDGVTFAAPKFEDQDSFWMPRVSSNRRYAGWLALFPNRGASYSQPLDLVILDVSNQIRHYGGNFGMVFGWCFSESSSAVIYRYQFPHGATPTGFDMRRLKDGKLLRRIQLEPTKPDEDEFQLIRARAPAWTKCARSDA
jgi:hypothetical protein